MQRNLFTSPKTGQTLFTWEENISFWKNMFLGVVFFTIAPLTLAVSLFSLYTLKSSDKAKWPEDSVISVTSPLSGVRVYASLPTQYSSVSSSVESADARPEIIRSYLEKYNSPMLPYYNFIVEVADKYGVDFRLTTAIAQQESNVCKIIPPGGYNCWGWGITGSSTLGFNSFAEGIETVTKGLRENYLDKGYTTIPDIMSKYTPHSNGSWAIGVSQFMQEMQ